MTITKRERECLHKWEHWVSVAGKDTIICAKGCGGRFNIPQVFTGRRYDGPVPAKYAKD